MPFAMFAIAALLSTAAAHPTTSDEARVLRPLREQQPNAVKSRSNVIHATSSDEARVLGALNEQPNAMTGKVERKATTPPWAAVVPETKHSQQHGVASSW